MFQQSPQFDPKLYVYRNVNIYHVYVYTSIHACMRVLCVYVCVCVYALSCNLYLDYKLSCFDNFFSQGNVIPSSKLAVEINDVGRKMFRRATW